MCNGCVGSLDKSPAFLVVEAVSLNALFFELALAEFYRCHYQDYD